MLFFLHHWGQHCYPKHHAVRRVRCSNFYVPQLHDGSVTCTHPPHYCLLVTWCLVFATGLSG